MQNETGLWRCAATTVKYAADIDEYRAKHGKEEGEARFFAEHAARETIRVPGNLLLVGGASLVWRCLIGDGTATASQANTFLNAAQARIAVGDGGPVAVSGTVSATNNSQSITFSTTQSNLIGHHLIFSGDTTHGVYKVTSGSGTGWTIEPAYAGSTATGMAANRIAGVADAQTDLQATTNKTRRVMDSGFPRHVSGSTTQAITGATNAAPIVISCANDYAENDFVLISGVGGNTAANGIWRISNVTGTGFTLPGSNGNAAYSSGGVASRSRVVSFQATFGGGEANHAWNEWGLANAATGGTLLNRRVLSLGVKSPGATWTFAVGVSIV